MVRSEKFYRLLVDPSEMSRWYLGSAMDMCQNEIDPRIFTQGGRVEFPPDMCVRARRAGRELDFNFCDFDMVVASSEVGEKLLKIVGSAIQRIPVMIDSAAKAYEILNICKLVSCLDRDKSLFTEWSAKDGRPEKVGQLRMVARLKIDPAVAKGQHVFRIAEWPIAVIVSSNVKDWLVANKVSGIKYEAVV